MARNGVTYEEVAEIADRLLREQANPTIEAVRYALGQTGSFSTISKHLNAWRSQRLLAAAKEAPEKILPPDEISQAVQGVWERLDVQFQQQLAQYKNESEEKISALLEEKQQLETIKETLQQKLEKLETQASQLAADVTLLRKELNEERRLHAVAEAEANHRQELLAQEQTEKQARLAHLQVVYDKSVAEWKDHFTVFERERKNDVDQLKTLLENQRIDFMVKCDEANTAKEKLQKALGKAESELQQKLARVQEKTEQAKALEIEVKLAQQQTKEDARLLTEQEKQMAELKTELRLKNEFIDTLKQQIEALQIQLAQREEPSK